MREIDPLKEVMIESVEMMSLFGDPKCPFFEARFIYLFPEEWDYETYVA